MVVNTTPARIDREPGPEVGAALRLDGRLAEEVATAREGREELVVEVVPIGQHDDGGVRHRRLADDAPGVEGHGEALARALGVPDDSDAPVARLPARLASGLVPPAFLPQPLLGRAQGLGDRRLDRVELVVARHLLREPARAIVLEHDEVAEEGEKAARLERPLDRHLELGEEYGSQLLARDRAPGLEPLPSAGESAEPGLDPVRYREHRVEGEEGGHLLPVGPELLPGAADGCVLGRRVLELDDGERQAVHEQHDVGATLVVVLDHRELVDREPVVVGRPLEVEHPHRCSPDRAAAGAVLHRHPGHGHAVEGAVAGFQGRPFGACQLAEGVVQGLGGQVRVEAGEGPPHHGRKERVRVALPERVRPGRHVRPPDHVVAERPEPVERRLLHHRLGHGGHGYYPKGRPPSTFIFQRSPSV